MGFSQSLPAILLGFFFFSLFGLVITSFSLTLAGLFMGLVFSSTYYFVLMVGDYMTYMLFLVYLGGLLVLLIYMIMVASNFSKENASAPGWFLASGVIGCWGSLLYNRSNPSEAKMVLSNSTLILNLGCIVLLFAFLLYVFLNICAMVITGGRSLSYGVTT